VAKTIKTAVVGTGHFGLYHAQKLAKIPGSELVAVADTDVARAAEVASQLGVEAITNPSDLIGRVDAVSIVVPTRSHFDVAAEFLKAGVHVMVEKPITGDEASARELIALASANKAILQVGHLARFSSVTEALIRSVDKPLYIESVRVAPFKPRGTDVNVILDLMIHDLDLVLALTDTELTDVDAVGTSVLSESEDMANARLKFEGGCIANITASRVSLKTERKMRIFQRDTYISVDFDAQTLRTFRKVGDAGDGMPNVVLSQDSLEETDALELELAAFVASAQDGTQPLVTGEAGLRALLAAQRVTDSLRKNAQAAVGVND
jgi:predicted dehydrogenase